MKQPRTWLIGAAAIATAGMLAEGGAQLRVGLEDRDDPSPRQVAVGMTVAGLVLGVAVSWSRRGPPLDAR